MIENAMTSEFAQEGIRNFSCVTHSPRISGSLNIHQPRGKHLNRLLLLLCMALLVPNSNAQIDNSTKQLAQDIFKQLIEINTTDSVGNVTTASEAMAQRFRDAGFPESDIHIAGPNDRKKNLVVRYHGSGKHKPVLLIGHLDVVEARREDWTTDPFQFVEKDGYFYGRGTQDMKDGDAVMVTTLLRFKKEGFVPDRDIILALTADEEGGQSNGVDWLIKNHRDWIDAEFVLNHDGGGIVSEHGKPFIMTIEPAEKLYADYTLGVTNPGGHSSLPVPDNAIYRLAEGLTRLENHKFPVEVNNITRAYFERMSKVEKGQKSADMKAVAKEPPDAQAAARLSQDPIYNSVLHTTCVATRLNAGHANNALPQRAEANVNCRIEPGHSPEDIRQQLEKIVADPKISISYVGAIGGGPKTRAVVPPPLREDVMKSLEKITGEMWRGLPVIPDQASGASDGVYTNAAGMPTYCVSGEAIDRDDIRAHGKDERVRRDSFYNAVDFYYRFLKSLTGAS
jgi:acetylornithine deacetylase/succinyl-diaminopimelate desuccinylase-like protein